MNVVPRIWPAKYRGVTFRSYLEVDWAMEFDARSLRWSYEPLFLQIGNLGYLVDFWLPELEVYVEVKPIPPDMKAVFKTKLLHKHTGDPVYFFVGYPRQPAFFGVFTRRWGDRSCTTFEPVVSPLP